MNGLGKAAMVSLLLNCNEDGSAPQQVDSQTQMSLGETDNPIYVPGCMVQICGSDKRSFPGEKCDIFESALAIHGKVRFCLDEQRNICS